MNTHVASLDCTDLGNGYLSITGTVVIDGETRTIDYQAPRFMLDAVIAAAVKEGALT